jgi:MFS family permease
MNRLMPGSWSGQPSSAWRSSLASPYSFAAFFESFAAEFAAQRADVALVFGLSGLIYFVLGASAPGMLADRFGPRVVCCAGMLCIAGGLFATSLAHSMAAVYLSYGVGIGVGIALVYTPAIASVQPWFTRRRGLAAGIASAGIGAGTLVVPLLATSAIAWVQWRDALRLLALGVLVLGLGAALLLRRAPAGASPRVRAGTGSSLREALHSRSFWWLYLSRGRRTDDVRSVCPCVRRRARPGHRRFAGRGPGRPDRHRQPGGPFRDRRPGRPHRPGQDAGADAALHGRVVSAVVRAGGYTALALFALWFGLSYGGIVSLLPALCMDLFGARAVASIIGTLYTGAALGNLLGPGPLPARCLTVSAATAR